MVRVNNISCKDLMIFSLVIYSPPSSQSSLSAYEFAEALLSQGHSLYRVFFYYDGVYHGSNLTCPPQGMRNINHEWDVLQKKYEFDLDFCIAASIKRGILNEAEAERYEKKHSNLVNNGELAGLGQLVDAALNSDRLLTFGG